MSHNFNKSFPKPRNVTVDENGSIVLEYWVAPGEHRILVMIENVTDEGRVALYISYVSRTEMWVREAKNTQEVADLLMDKMGLVAE